MTGVEYLDITTHIRRDGVYFGEDKPPGLIAEDGVVLKPGGSDDFNTLIVTFLVGPVVCDDPLVERDDTVEWPATPVTHYHSKGNPYADLKCSSVKPRKHALSTPKLCEKESHHDGPHQAGDVKWIDVDLKDKSS